MANERANPLPEDPGANLPHIGESRMSAGGITISELTSAVKECALAHGFDVAAVAPPGLGQAHGRYLEWIERGYAGEMSYLSRNPYVRGDLRRLWPETRAALVVAMCYRPEQETPHAEGQGKIARYAHGGDYHKFMKKRLIRVLRDLKSIDPGIEGRSYVDTGPLLERDLAVMAGLGWKGKNSLLLSRKLGSYFFLGCLLLNRALEVDAPFTDEHCGTCTRCIDDCPTDAIVAPGVVDARRCISYLTIELRGPIPRELRAPVGAHVFGCDICQEVCPWNDDAPTAREPRFAPRPAARNPQLLDFLAMSEIGFQKAFRGTPIMRARYGGFLRNVIVAIGNTGGAESMAPLARALDHREPLARGHAAWALARVGKRIRDERARLALEARLEVERDAWVREEIELALGEFALLSLPVLGWDE